MAVKKKFAALEQYFRQMSTTTSELKLSFSEIEEITGASLCNSAYKYFEYWSNSYSHSNAAAWLNAGYRSSKIDLENKTVTFIKA